MSPVENLVIGGGPAGTMTALTLAAAGRPVTLLEGEPGAHHKVCGEFLSREAAEYLERAGISPAALGAGRIRLLRLSAGGGTIETRLPFPALSLSRYVLDEALLERAGQSGCTVRRGVRAEALEADGGRWCVTTRGGERLHARTVFLATGKHDLRGWGRSRGSHSDLVGFKLHWRLRPAQAEAVRESMELFLFRGGYGGLTLVEADAANLCLVVGRSELAREGGWPALLARIRAETIGLAARLEGAGPLADRPLAISPIPYGYLTRGDDLWRVGDQAAVIPSFTGDGLSIALHSGALAARMHLEGRTAADFHRLLAGQLRGAMSLALLLSRLMVTAPARSLAVAGLGLWPGIMRHIALSTRIPAHAMVRPQRPGPAAP